MMKKSKHVCYELDVTLLSISDIPFNFGKEYCISWKITHSQDIKSKSQIISSKTKFWDDNVWEKDDYKFTEKKIQKFIIFWKKKTILNKVKKNVNKIQFFIEERVKGFEKTKIKGETQVDFCTIFTGSSYEDEFETKMFLRFKNEKDTKIVLEIKARSDVTGILGQFDDAFKQKKIEDMVKVKRAKELTTPTSKKKKVPTKRVPKKGKPKDLMENKKRLDDFLDQTTTTTKDDDDDSEFSVDSIFNKASKTLEDIQKDIEYDEAVDKKTFCRKKTPIEDMTDSVHFNVGIEILHEKYVGVELCCQVWKVGENIQHLGTTQKWKVPKDGKVQFPTVFEAKTIEDENQKLIMIEVYQINNKKFLGFVHRSKDHLLSTHQILLQNDRIYSQEIEIPQLDKNVGTITLTVPTVVSRIGKKQQLIIKVFGNISAAKSTFYKIIRKSNEELLHKSEITKVKHDLFEWKNCEFDLFQFTKRHFFEEYIFKCFAIINSDKNVSFGQFDFSFQDIITRKKFKLLRPPNDIKVGEIFLDCSKINII